MPLFCYLGLADYPLGLFFILDLFLRVPVSYPLGQFFIVDLSLRAAMFVVSISRVGGGNQRGRHGPSGLPLYALANVSHCSPRQAIRTRLDATSCFGEPCLRHPCLGFGLLICRAAQYV